MLLLNQNYVREIEYVIDYLWHNFLLFYFLNLSLRCMFQGRKKQSILNRRFCVDIIKRYRCEKRVSYSRLEGNQYFSEIWPCKCQGKSHHIIIYIIYIYSIHYT